jgi:hypothetical protein
VNPITLVLTGGQSVWGNWTAPASGQVTFDTLDSGFDTLLAVYVGDSVDALTPVASNDDVAGTLQSQLNFTALAGQTYRIAVDGKNGSAGRTKVYWQMDTAPPPSVTITAPANGTTLGSTVVVSASAAGATKIEFLLDGVRKSTDTTAPFDWIWNTADVENEFHTLVAVAYSGPTLIGSSRPVSVGVNNTPPLCSDPTELPEPNDRSTTATPLDLGAVRNAFICTPTDVDWFEVEVGQPGVVDFTLTVPPENDYDLELYGGDPIVWHAGSYEGLGSADRILFNAATPGTYYARVYGYPQGNGSHNADTPYTLSANFSAGAITIVTPPQDRTVPAGASAVFSVVASGAPPLSYQWQRSADGFAPFVDVPGATLATYATPPLTLADSGAQYRVRITSIFDAVTSAPATLIVTSPNVITWVGGYPNGWNNPTNWTPRTVPTSSDSVVVNSGSVTVPANAAFAVFSLDGGSVSGTFTNTGTLTWIDGTIGGGNITIASGGVLNIAGATTKYFGNAVVRLNNAGTINWLGSGGVYSGYSGGVYFTNLVDGVVNLQSDARFARGVDSLFSTMRACCARRAGRARSPSTPRRS